MKKVQLLIAAALLVSGTAMAQGTPGDGFRSVADCIGCAPLAPAAPTVRTADTNTFGTGFIDNCSEVVQGGAGVNVGNDNTAVVDQSGVRNLARLRQLEGNNNYGLQRQTGESNSADAIVYGSNNSTVQIQTGNFNRASINIDEVVGAPAPPEENNGDFNLAQQRQSGSNHDAEIDQLGDGNKASQDQFGGNNNDAKIDQRTDGSSAVQIQMGSDNDAITLQGRTGFTGDNGQRSSIEQGGSRNSAFVSQDVR